MSDEGKPEDTENKEPWLAFGEQREDTFIKEVAPRLGLSARKNPEKETDPTAIDLIVDGKPTDLKTQETPFFTAEKKYDLPPQYVVTFNESDYYRYKEKIASMSFFGFDGTRRSRVGEPVSSRWKASGESPSST